jgi:hypothetical protein
MSLKVQLFLEDSSKHYKNIILMKFGMRTIIITCQFLPENQKDSNFKRFYLLLPYEDQKLKKQGQLKTYGRPTDVFAGPKSLCHP